MRSCNCWQCSGDDYHIEQMRKAEQTISKDDYMENKPPSLYEKLDEAYNEMDTKEQSQMLCDLMDMVNAVDNELIALALELPTEQAEKLLAIQERLY